MYNNCSDDENEVLTKITRRYVAIIREHKDILDSMASEQCRSAALLGLCDEIASNCMAYPFDKMCRWLGFIQGTLCAFGILDVDTEREVTRPLFHGLYQREVVTFKVK